MSGNEYASLAMRTNDGKSINRLLDNLHNEKPIANAQLLNACLGLSGEVGEFNDIVKKYIFHETSVDILHLEKELGDIMWYIALACDSLGLSLDGVMRLNIDKLKARYPEGFDTNKSKNRAEGDI